MRTCSVSVIITVRNEEAALPALLASLAAQERPPNEIVIADGGSTDGTMPLLRAFAAGRLQSIAPAQASVRARVILLEAPGANIAQGRNAAIRAASGDVIAVTDAGVSLPSYWLQELARPLEEQPEVDCVSGYSRADPQTRFEELLAATTLPLVSEVHAASYLASSRTVAFRRSLWERAKGYPEWLDYSEDVVFDRNCQAAGAYTVFQPAASVRFRPRPNLRAYFIQYYRYARGDGKANLWPERHALRYAAYVLSGALLWRGRRNPLWWAVLGAAALAAIRKPFLRALTDPAPQITARIASALAGILILRIVGDIAKMLGYPVGLWWRWRHVRGRQVR